MILNCETYQLMDKLEGHNGRVLYACFFPDFYNIASCGADRYYYKFIIYFYIVMGFLK